MWEMIRGRPEAQELVNLAEQKAIELTLFAKDEEIRREAFETLQKFFKRKREQVKIS